MFCYIKLVFLKILYAFVNVYQTNCSQLTRITALSVVNVSHLDEYTSNVKVTFVH